LIGENFTWWLGCWYCGIGTILLYYRYRWGILSGHRILEMVNGIYIKAGLSA